MCNDTRGCSLIEALIATTIVIVALAGLAQLFVIAAAANRGSKERTVATILAQEKMEELLSLEGLRVGEGADFIDARGQRLGTSVSPPQAAFYTRRWSAAPLPENPSGAVVLQVWVTVLGGKADAARLLGVKTRRDP